MECLLIQGTIVNTSVAVLPSWETTRLNVTCSVPIDTTYENFFSLFFLNLLIRTASSVVLSKPVLSIKSAA